MADGVFARLGLDQAQGDLARSESKGLVIVTLAEPRAHIGLIRGAMLASVESLT